MIQGQYRELYNSSNNMNWKMDFQIKHMGKCYRTFCKIYKAVSIWKEWVKIRFGSIDFKQQKLTLIYAEEDREGPEVGSI